MRSEMTPEEESERLAGLLINKTVKAARRMRASELLIEFDEGLRLYVNAAEGVLELSVTEGPPRGDQ